MATVVEEKWLKDGATGSMSVDGVITWNESVIVTFSEVIDNTPDAISTAGYLQGQEHRNNANLTLVGDINLTPLDESNATQWRFDLVYDTSGQGFSVEPGNPRAIVDTGTWTSSQIVEFDTRNGNPIVNTAGDPFDPMPEEVIANPIIRVTLRQNSANMDRINDIGSVNESEIKIAGVTFPQYTAMLSDYSSQPNRDDEGFVTFNNTYTIKGKFKTGKDGSQIGWLLEILSQGFNEIRDGVRQGIRIREQTNIDDEGEDGPEYEYVPVAQPQLLDENGKATVNESEAVYQQFLPYKAISFSSFRLPTNYPS
jgi:hypothetical protein